jgi:hypothetical protein
MYAVIGEFSHQLRGLWEDAVDAISGECLFEEWSFVAFWLIPVEFAVVKVGRIMADPAW